MGLIEHVKGNRIYFDSNIFIYLFENFQPYITALTPILDQIEQGDTACFTSELTLAESLVKPIKTNNQQWQDAYTDSI